MLISIALPFVFQYKLLWFSGLDEFLLGLHKTLVTYIFLADLVELAFTIFIWRKIT